MPTNKLMEAAAEILSGSKSKAPAMPPKKLEGEIVDIGGPRNTDANPLDDSEKIDATKGTQGDSKSKASIKTHPSGASGKVVDSLKKEDQDFSGDVDSIFEDETISEDFKKKAATIFEARLYEKVSVIEEELEEKYKSMLEEAITTIQEDLESKIDDYITYVAEQWMEENKLAVDTGLRAELAEDFIVGLKNLFSEHYVDIPEDKVDVVEELSEKVVELESKLSEAIDFNIQIKKDLIESKKQEVIRDICEGLTDTQVEKMKALAESVNFVAEDEYKEKLEVIKESYFTQSIKKADPEQLHEKIEDDGTKPVISDPFVDAVSKAISKTKF